MKVVEKVSNTRKVWGCEVKAELQLSVLQNSEQRMTSILSSLSTPLLQWLGPDVG